ncbi:GGDEF domain-containing protein [Azospirillum halopraeferens]|uniref:GGDEF domain-containing protein n=1 Tax=Azospirillum halopraeferens TaxID=34010 RepID=UPI001FE23B3C|nr:diguanylate cyclase [Azospirillum halopraeferens]
MDDDTDVHRATRILLRDRRFRGRPLRLISALSALEARAVIAREDDIALALVDVVMETDTAGLDLLAFIRSEAANPHMRVVLRTGQPGHAPEERVVLDYDIDGYAAKPELTSRKLFSIVVSALRTYEALRELARLNRELEARVAQRTAELERLAMIDSLTGLPNRRHFLARAEMEVAAAQRAGHALHVLAVDLDHFKTVNDTFGHGGGDAALKAVADALTRCLRPLDFCCRLGGEEFLLLLPALSDADARAVADRLRATIAHTPVVHDGTTITITASVGISRLAVAAPSAETTIEPALARADRALFRAKRAGRDRVAEEY